MVLVSFSVDNIKLFFVFGQKLSFQEVNMLNFNYAKMTTDS